MKRFLSVLVVLAIFATQMCAFAETSYTSLLDAVKADESVDMSLIDEDKIIYAEITSYINLDKGIKPTSFYLYMPSVDSDDFYTAGFDKNEYVSTIRNFVATEPLKYYSIDEAKEFAANNGLSEPTEIKAILTHGRIGLFAYSVVCDGKEYIIPYYFTDDSTYNITKDNTVRLSLGTAYTIDEFVNISEKEHTLYDEYMAAENDKKSNTTSYVDNDGEVVESKDAEIKTPKAEEKKTEIYTYDELTGITQKNIVEATIRKHADSISITSPLIITNIVNDLKNIELRKDESEGGSAGGWRYWIQFKTDDNKIVDYTDSTGIKVDGIDYRPVDWEKPSETLEYYYNLYAGIGSVASEWAVDYIAEAVELGILSANNSYYYTAAATREGFCNLAVKMIESDGTTLPTDNPQRPLGINDTDNVNVLKLYKAGIILGKEHNKTGIVFAPNDLITREEAAVILHRIATYLNISSDESLPYANFSDGTAISDWAGVAVHTMYQLGVMKGVSDTEFSPKGLYTIEQTIATLVRLAKEK